MAKNIESNDNAKQFWENLADATTLEAGTQTALRGKIGAAASSHTHSLSDITELGAALAEKQNVAPIALSLGANGTWFPASPASIPIIGEGDTMTNSYVGGIVVFYRLYEYAIDPQNITSASLAASEDMTHCNLDHLTSLGELSFYLTGLTYLPLLPASLYSVAITENTDMDLSVLSSNVSINSLSLSVANSVLPNLSGVPIETLYLYTPNLIELPLLNESVIVEFIISGNPLYSPPDLSGFTSLQTFQASEAEWSSVEVDAIIIAVAANAVAGTITEGILNLFSSGAPTAASDDAIDDLVALAWTVTTA